MARNSKGLRAGRVLCPQFTVFLDTGERMSGTVDRVSTLLIIVGFPQSPLCAGKGVSATACLVYLRWRR